MAISIRRKGISPDRNILGLARDYIRQGYCVIPIPRGQKNPIRKGWPDLRITADTAPAYFGDKACNIGFHWGKASGGRVDVDLDCEEAVTLAPRLLVESARYGRKSRPNSHRIYRSPGARTRKWVDPEYGTLVELRAEGSQSLVPGSIHDSGERVRWDRDDAPTLRDPELLTAEVAKLASASVILKRWTNYSRDDLCTALVGMLLRSGWSVEETTAFIDIIATAAHDEEKDKRLTKVQRLAEHLQKNDGGVPGRPKLVELIGEPVVRKIVQWLSLDRSSEVIEELNQKFAVVSIGGRTAILHEHDDRLYPGTQAVEYWRVPDLHVWYANRRVANAPDPQSVPISFVWLKSPHRRQYSGVVFEPNQKDTGSNYNLWRGWRVRPKKGSWQRLREHLFENVADRNEAACDWLVAFMADAIQRPQERAGVSAVLQGVQGAGKGIVWNALGYLFGRHYIQVTDGQHLTGKFNVHLQDKLLIFADEGFFDGDKRRAGVLKGMITEPWVTIEPKGLNAFQIPNRRRVVFATNEDWAVPAGLEERRFAVFTVNPRRARNRKYFGRILRELEQGGYEAMLYDLLHFDLAGVDLFKLPSTPALWQQKKLTFDAAEQFWFERLLDGEQIPGARRWRPKVRSAALTTAFADSIKGRPQEQRSLQTKLGMKLRKLCPAIESVEESHFGAREHYYRFPTLETCREDFERAVRTSVDWTTGEARL